MAKRKHPEYSFDLDVSGFELPEGFLFGVCNSPYHAEGGYNTNTGPHNNWSEWESSGRIERSGATNRMWVDPMPHVERSKEIGLNTFRLGFEWARVQPTFGGGKGPAPGWDHSAFDRYAEIVGNVYEAGMEPVVTLHHFTNPAWIGSHLWLDDDLIGKFLAYVQKVVVEVSERLVNAGHPPIRTYVTINEPFNCAAGPYLGGDHPPGRTRDYNSFNRALANVLYAHVKIYDAIYDLYEARNWRRPHVGFNVVTYSVYELDKVMVDMTRAPSLGVGREDAEAHVRRNKAKFDAAYTEIARRRLNRMELWYWERFRNMCAEKFGEIDFTRFWDAIYASPRPNKLDYVALDCYDPFSLGTPALKNPLKKWSPSEPGGGRPWWEWTFDPHTFREHLYLHGRGLEDLPLYIMETNIGHKQEKFGKAEPRPDGLTRPQFLKESLREVMRAIQDGIPLQGYLYWSLCDNYEWGSFTTRLGLVEYDYGNHVIRNTDGLDYPTAETFAELIGAMRSSEATEINQAFSP